MSDRQAFWRNKGEKSAKPLEAQDEARNVEPQADIDQKNILND